MTTMTIPTIEPLADQRGALLDEYDTLIAELDAALAAEQAPTRQRTIVEHRITLVCLALGMSGETDQPPA